MFKKGSGEKAAGGLGAGSFGGGAGGSGSGWGNQGERLCEGVGGWFSVGRGGSGVSYGAELGTAQYKCILSGPSSFPQAAQMTLQ